MKFSIRDLLLVMMIVALAVAWCMDRRATHEEMGTLRNQLMELRGAYDAVLDSHAHESVRVRELERGLNNAKLSDSSAPAPSPPKP
jgi:hypothetical protein